MTARALIVVAALAGCGRPSPLFCQDDSTCGGGACIAQFCADADSMCPSGFRYHESAGEKAGECTGGGGSGGGEAGADGGTFADPIETLPAGEAGKVVDASMARNDIVPTCATNPAGRDVMFEITVPAGLNRLYVDTDQTAFAVVLAVYAGSCSSISSATSPLACVTTGCDARTMQWSAEVQAGVHCIVVDQASSEPASVVHVRGMYGPTARTAQVGTTTGTTCGHDAFGPAGQCIVPDGPDEAWFFMACGGTFVAMTPVGWPGDIEARTETVQYDCDTGEVGADFTLARPGPVWLIAHQSAGACGQLSLQIY